MENGGLRPEDRQALDALKQRLLGAGVPVTEMRAFGSRVRGDFDAESDLDVLVVLRDRSPAIDDAILQAAWDVAFEVGYVVTPIVVTARDLRSVPLSLSPLIAAVRREGVRV